MKKILLHSTILFAALLIILSFKTSYQKETVAHVADTDTIYHCPPSINGLWIGDQQNSSGGQAFTMSIKPDGTMTYENIVFNTQQLCIGTWTLVNSAFECNTECVYGHFVGVKQKFTANFDVSTGTLSAGQWINTYPSSNTDAGVFTLTKVY